MTLQRSVLLDSVRKLDPRIQIRNPVMFVVEIGAVIATGAGIVGGGGDPRWFTFTVAIWLWLTVIFANLAEALAEPALALPFEGARHQGLHMGEIGEMTDAQGQFLRPCPPRDRQGRHGGKASQDRSSMMSTRTHRSSGHLPSPLAQAGNRQPFMWRAAAPCPTVTAMAIMSTLSSNCDNRPP